ncbi:hypothetical protein TNIN_92861 [Trichonephila inaurata madagascariensis]|uniref:Uncharacterized protein n=1 Tax=Trichonephila inaurata madagascariensis TaxID=2747483 RepID=A0A8X7BX37_9ARAC|nr:hypothetical protein TNIN_92861 [Trichonephila inaurata madagascariensis]
MKTFNATIRRLGWTGSEFVVEISQHICFSSERRYLLAEIDIRPSGVAINSCVNGSGNHKMVEMVQLDRYGRAEISQRLGKVVWGSRYASGLCFVGMECIVSVVVYFNMDGPDRGGLWMNFWGF